MGRPARALHDAGNHRTVERRSPRQAARRGGGLTIPASPAGERETTAALTPLLGARSAQRFSIEYHFTSQRFVRTERHSFEFWPCGSGCAPEHRENEFGELVAI